MKGQRDFLFSRAKLVLPMVVFSGADEESLPMLTLNLNSSYGRA